MLPSSKSVSEINEDVSSPSISFRIMLSLAGIFGVMALLLYFAAPFVIFPFPQANATSAQLAQSVSNYQTYYLLAAWLQGTGSLLSVVFVLGLVYLSKAWTKFSGWITMLASGTVVVLSLIEGSYFIDIVLATANGHPEAALTSFDLTFVFIHSFFIAPSILLPLGFVLRGSRILPRFFWSWALVTGLAFQIFGFAGLFTNSATIPAIMILIIQEVWFLAAAISLALRR